MIQPKNNFVSIKEPQMNEEQTKQNTILKDALLSTTDSSKNNYHLNAALEWAKNGYPVLPLNPRTKAPLLNGG